MEIYFSKTSMGFFHGAYRRDYELAGTWPEDATPISQRWYEYLLKGQEQGKQISSNEYGQPVLKPVEILWKERAESERGRLLDKGREITEELLPEMLLGTINADDKKYFSAWLCHTALIKRMRFEGINDAISFEGIKWPERPSRNA